MIAAAESSDDTNHNPDGRPRAAASAAGFRSFLLWTIIGLLVGLAAALVALRQASYDPTPTLTPAAFHAAQEKWKSAAPQDYEVEIRVTGPQAAVYRVEVRNGEPRAAWRNDQPLASRRTFGTWSVPG